MPHPDISIVIPMYNEEDNVAPLCDAVRQALDGWDRTWELILVEDGSRDRTLERLHAQAAADPGSASCRCGATPARPWRWPPGSSRPAGT